MDECFPLDGLIQPFLFSSLPLLVEDNKEVSIFRQQTGSWLAVEYSICSLLFLFLRLLLSFLKTI